MSDLIELSVAEVDKMAEVVAARISHPSHTPARAIRAGLSAVNAMRLDGAQVPRVELVQDRRAPGTMPRPIEARRPLQPVPAGKRRVSHLGMAERPFVWEDADGDHWRWCFMQSLWQYKQFDDPNGPQWVNCPSHYADQAPNPNYGPFTEVGRA
ncbi:hypothetical protein SEA_STINSON_72 [Mycobacterium phage Stinson]|uniref:DUF7183 domain-containing protein n=1 Tax=Mycobacterium phage Murucutumbu TaxID=1560286 RepID=A0A0A0RMF6_9CAUD|nr:hypothetical protein AVV71_gp29 [Mycobacterium phage Murucutumbu]AIW03058.1 hypothetical protein MURUCUTUMBU_72 [Mycobacterium phage Murucutumbu]QWK51404.1 hypothetical protein SEA_STINSON_72 [Mycobacterium phage Stinson]